MYDIVLTEDPNDFLAKVISEPPLEIMDVCRSAVERGSANTSAETMEYNVNLFFKAMAYHLCDGFSINTGYFMAHAQLKGAYDSPSEKFDPQKHALLFQFIQGELMRRMLPENKVEILGVAESGITIAEVTDVKSGSINDLLTPNYNLKIKGGKIKLAGEHTLVGIYFINQADDQRTKIPADDIVTNNPSELIIVIPELAAGTYQLEITTQFTNDAIFLKGPG